MDWLVAHPILSKFHYHNYNGGLLTEGQRINLRLMGLRAGVSDLFICYPTKSYHGLFLEMKRDMRYSPSARKSETWIAQEEFINNMRSVGFAGEWCYGCLDGINIIEKYLLT